MASDGMKNDQQSLVLPLQVNLELKNFVEFFQQ